MNKAIDTYNAYCAQVEHASGTTDWEAIDAAARAEEARLWAHVEDARSGRRRRRNRS